MVNFIILILLFLSRVFFLSPLPIYFDSPEYVRLIENPSLLQGLTLGHEPIHPGYILPSWLLFHMLKGISALYAAEVTSAVFSTLGIFVFYKIVQVLFDKKIAIRSLIIASLLPVFYLAGINVLTDTTYIFFFLLSFFAFLKFLKEKNKKWLLIGIISLGYSVFTHTQVLIWTPVFFGLLVASRNPKETLKEIITLLFAGTAVGILFLLFLLTLTGDSIIQGLTLLFRHGADFILSGNLLHMTGQALRNFFITMLRDNSTLVIIAAVIGFIILWRSRKTKYGKRNLAVCILWLLPALLTSQYWHIGLFGRVSVMASFPIAILASQIKSKTIFKLLVLSLLFTSIPLIVSNRNASIQGKLAKLYNSIPPKSLLISSNLIRPQATFTGEKYFINEPNQDIQFIEEKIDNALKNNRGVYVDSQALYNPYYSYDGNNLHILSLGSIGKSEIVPIFKKYKIRIVRVIDVNNRIFLYQVNPQGKNLNIKKTRTISGKAKPGKEIFLYSNNLSKRINPNRIDYMDIGMWMWVLLSGRNEPVLWTVTDKTGTYQIPY